MNPKCFVCLKKGSNNTVALCVKLKITENSEQLLPSRYAQSCSMAWINRH